MSNGKMADAKKYLRVFCLMSIALLTIAGSSEVSAVLNSWLPGNEKAVSAVVSIGVVWLIMPYLVIPAYYVFSPPPSDSRS